MEKNNFGPINQSTLDRERRTIGCDILRGRFYEYGDEEKKTTSGNPGENSVKPAYRNISLCHQVENDKPAIPGNLGTSLNETSLKTVEIETEVDQNLGNPKRNQCQRLGAKKENAKNLLAKAGSQQR
jgi:hypothetical protein